MPPSETRAPLGSRRFRRRVQHHLVIAMAALALAVAVASAFDRGDFRSRVSAATAYVAMACVALSLVLGPLNLIRGLANPLSSDLRRDLGIWGGIVGLLHVGVGLTVHLRGKMYQYFLRPPERHGAFPFRLDAFGAANDLGLLAGGVLLLLLLLSSDLALRRLGTTRWKRLQRLNYYGAIAILGHGVLYQIQERRRIALVSVFVVIVVTTLALQRVGFRNALRRRSHAP